MSRTARTYLTFIVILGACCIVRALWCWSPHDLPRFLFYLILAAPAASLKVRLPGITGTMSVLFVFLLAGLVELGLAETIVIGSTCVIIQCVWQPKVRPRPVQVAFSVANIALAITVADLAYTYWLSPLHVQASLRIAITASVFFVANTLPVAIVIALTERKSVRQVWTDCYCWSFPYYLVGAAIVAAFTFADRVLNWEAWLLIVPVVYTVYRSYQLYLQKLSSERQRAEDQQKHSDEVARLHERTIEALASAVSANTRLEAVIQASPLAIFTLDGEERVTTWNLMAEHMFGWSGDEVLGRTFPAGGAFQGSGLEIIERTLHGEVLSGLQTRQLRKDGSSFEAAIWSSPLRDPEDSPGIVLAVADVSDRKRLEEQLRLSQKMEAVGRLAGGIAHDFNNLLTIINGYSSMLAHSLEADSYAASQADEIVQAGNRAAELVSQLLTFSRRQVNQPKSIDVNELVQEVARMLRRLIGEHIELSLSLDENAGWILADRNQMEAALMNLATNARDAMGKGGLLSISTARVHVSKESDTADLPDGEYVCLSVADTGHGMDAETQQHLFEPFFTTKAKGKGTGLGLSSVYGGVQHNRGRIFVSSEVGKGTVFSIYLPCHDNVASEPTRPAIRERLLTGTETILLVEDETALRRMLREALSNAGFRIWEASNAAEAIEHWESHIQEISLVVTDVVMPVMNGKELADHLRKIRPALKVVFMSGHAEDVLTDQGMLDPSLDLLPKPFLPEALVKKVRQALDRVYCT